MIGGDDPTLRDGYPHRVSRDLIPGALIGRYVIKKVAGRGAMGIVYVAHDRKLDREVALKLLAPTNEDADALVDEARALAKLTDPHVVAVYDAGEIDGSVFIAMQYVDGETLAAVIERLHPSPKQILEWFVAAGRGLAAAHAAGLVHRDFKPANVLVDARGRVAVTDFGLAREVRRHATDAGVLSGTPAYMSPEQFEGEVVTQASDQFSFCVSLWEALFGSHPFLRGNPGMMSPLEIRMVVLDAELVPPKKKVRVSNAVTAALTRGLARKPEDRWPSLAVLLEVLAPPPRMRVLPLVAAGAIAAAVAGGIVWFALARADAAAPSCEVRAAERLARAWQPLDHARLAAQFIATGRPYAHLAEQAVTAGIERYVSRWQGLAGDVCAAEHAAPVPQRRACLDSRLDALRGLASVLTSDVRPELVDQGTAVLDALPDLGSCVATTASAPPPPLAPAVASLEQELAVASARGIGGDYQRAVKELTAVAQRAELLGYAPLTVRAHLALATQQASLLSIAPEHARRAATLALANNLEHEGVKALAILARGRAHAGDNAAVDDLVAVARALAERARDPELTLFLEVAHGRALVRLHRWREAVSVCRQANADAIKLATAEALDSARVCLLEALAPAGATSEMRALIDQLIADATRRLSPDHPRLADYLRARADQEVGRGELDQARRDAERVFAIRSRVYPPRHRMIAEALTLLADVSYAEDKAAEAEKLYREAFALVDERDPDQLVQYMRLAMMVANYEMRDDRDQALARYAHVAALVRERVGSSSVELAVVLINYGQRESAVDVDAALRLVAEARDILERNKDPRVQMASLAAAIIAEKAERWPDVVRFAGAVLPLLDRDEAPEQYATTELLLARGLVQTHGDVRRAKELARDARALFVRLGPSFRSKIQSIDAFLAR